MCGCNYLISKKKIILYGYDSKKELICELTKYYENKNKKNVF